MRLDLPVIRKLAQLISKLDELHILYFEDNGPAKSMIAALKREFKPKQKLTLSVDDFSKVIKVFA